MPDSKDAVIAQLVKDLADLRLLFEDQHKHQGGDNRSVPAPKPLSLSGDKKENLLAFRHAWTNYLIASGLENKFERDKIANLQILLGTEAYLYIKNLPLTADDQSTAEKILDALERHLLPEINVIYERAMFNTAKQEPGETADEYVNRLRKLIKNCKYADLADEFLRDRIVVSIRDRGLQKHFYEKSNLTLMDAINQMKISENAQQQLQQITNETQQVNLIDRRTRNNQYFNNQRSTSVPRTAQNSSQRSSLCNFCGQPYHERSQCPAAFATCDFCHLRGHYKSMCLKKSQPSQPQRSRSRGRQNYRNNYRGNNRQQNTTNRQNVNTLNNDVTSSSSPQEQNYIYKINSNENAKALETNLLFSTHSGPKTVRCQMDTGATCNVVGYSNFCDIVGDSKPLLNDTQTTIKCFGGTLIQPMGQTVIDCIRDNRIYKLLFQVVRHSHPPLLSANACEKLRLIKICNVITTNSQQSAADIIEKYADVFDGIGKLAEPVALEIDETVKPIIDNPRRIPIAVKPAFEEIITELESMGIIEKITHHTDWVSNSLLVLRNGKRRLCIDPCYLNRALKRINYQMPTIDEILPELANARIFTTLDAKKGFWQLALDSASSDLTTFWGPSGRYRWLRVPFGISPAPELFQQRLHSIIHGLKGVEVVADDILVYGSGNSDEQALCDHNSNLEKLLQRLREVNLKLNKDKMELCKPNVKFYGHVLTDQGIKADVSKITAIVEMPTPTDVLAVQRFLGMITYLNRYIPSLSTHTTILRKLTTQDAEFKWTCEEQKCFDHLKHLLTTAPVLAYFDVHKPIVIECDASSTGLGSVLLQDNRPIAYASRALTTTEQNYAQIEKETLAIVFSCIRFSQYITAKHISIRSDHKPLENIFSKPLVKAPKRIQRMLMQLQNYNVTVSYVKGKSLHLADALSRAYINDQPHPDERSIEKVNSLMFIQMSDQRVKSIAEATLTDPQMQQLAEIILSGWPNTSINLPRHLQQFFQHRDELTHHNGLILKGQRIVIPESLRADMIQRLHHSHCGMEATLRLARETVYWPNITDHIKNKIGNCHICISNSVSNRKEPMQSVQPPELPFQLVSMDLMETDDEDQVRRHYLITVDHYSDYFEIDLLDDQRAITVVSKCKKNFASHGIPEVVICDNGSQFLSTEFRKFATKYEFNISPCSPYHKEGNGKAEATVKIAKSLITKSIEAKTDIELVLLNWRNTPNKIGTSPTQRLYSRRTRCLVPCAPELMVPKVIHGVQDSIIDNKIRSKQYHDDKCRKEAEFQPGEMIFVRLNDRQKKWLPGIISSKLKSRVYDIEVNGKQYRRNSIHIKPASSHQYNQPLVTSNDNTLDYTSAQQQSRPNASISPSANENRIIQTGRHEMSELTNRSSSSKAATTPNRSSMEVFNRSTPESRNLYLTPTSSLTPILGRPKRRIRQPVRFADYAMDDSENRGDVM
jgi:hypothetical protein